MTLAAECLALIMTLEAAECLALILRDSTALARRRRGNPQKIFSDTNDNLLLLRGRGLHNSTYTTFFHIYTSIPPPSIMTTDTVPPTRASDLKHEHPRSFTFTAS